MKCKPTTGGSEESTLQGVVQAYIRTNRVPASRELRFFTIQLTLGEAIRKASLCQLPGGKRHDHQRRIPSASLAEANRRLQLRAADIQKCRCFTDLHALVEEEIGSIHMIGALTVYDVAHRIGARVELEPDVIYLHAGTEEGARLLVPTAGKRTLQVSDLPRPFHCLKPYEAEDCLCIYKEEISRIVYQQSELYR